jgi:hypothetical protein
MKYNTEIADSNQDATENALLVYASLQPAFKGIRLLRHRVCGLSTGVRLENIYIYISRGNRKIRRITYLVPIKIIKIKYK